MGVVRLLHVEPQSREEIDAGVISEDVRRVSFFTDRYARSELLETANSDAQRKKKSDAYLPDVVSSRVTRRMARAM